MKRVTLCFISGFLMLCTDNYSCTSFCFSTDSSIYLGNTLDYTIGHGLIIVNKRNVSKTAIWYSNPAQWTSKYGSITVNQWGREFPARGINEKGLAMGEMYLAETLFPHADSRPQLKLEQWMQYQLDNCATVQEVIESENAIRIATNESTSHFFAADSSGNCVVMEWLNGQLVYHTMETLPVKVSTNNTYESSLEYYNAGNPPQSNDFSSLARFYRAAEMIDSYNPLTSGPAFEYSLEILAGVNQGDFTKWSLLYDIKNLCFYYSTNTNPNLCYVDLKSVDFSCNTPVKVLNIYTSYTGDVAAHFINDNFTINYNNDRDAATAMGIYPDPMSDQTITEMANYPATTSCDGIENTNASTMQDNLVELYPNFPNPFNSVTAIHYTIEKPLYVKLIIYDMLGQVVRTLENSYMNTGDYVVEWDGMDDLNQLVSSGIYFCRLESDNERIHRMMIFKR